jgi:hypothetical protein
VRRAIATARKSLREPDQLLGALQTLRDVLVGAAHRTTGLPVSRQPA